MKLVRAEIIGINKPVAEVLFDERKPGLWSDPERFCTINRDFSSVLDTDFVIATITRTAPAPKGVIRDLGLGFAKYLLLNDFRVYVIIDKTNEPLINYLFEGVTLKYD